MKNRDISATVASWLTPAHPTNMHMDGRFSRLAPLSGDSHGAAIFAANSQDTSIWNYLPYGPFATSGEYLEWVEGVENKPDPVFLAIYDKEQSQWAGVASYLRIAQKMGSIEVGHINYSAPLQRTRAATEAMYLMMKWAFDAGYRRYEWKCNAANMPSRRAAERFGFSYEGVFRQHLIINGRNRDTAWFAIIDSDWPAMKLAFESWLDPSNFDDAGRQKTALSDLSEPVLVMRDPALL